jgi:hypothetical protein
VLVPVVAEETGMGRLVPAVMFGSLGVLFVLTWHKGAALRALLRMLGVSGPQALAPADAPVARQRVELGAGQQVRVHTTDLDPEEQAGTTEVQSSEAPRARRGA